MIVARESDTSAACCAAFGTFVQQLLTEGSIKQKSPLKPACHSPTPCPSQHFPTPLQTPRLLHQTPPPTLLSTVLHPSPTTSHHTTHPPSCLPSLCKRPPIPSILTIDQKYPSYLPRHRRPSCHRSGAAIKRKLPLANPSQLSKRRQYGIQHMRERLTHRRFLVVYALVAAASHGQTSPQNLGLHDTTQPSHSNLTNAWQDNS